MYGVPSELDLSRLKRAALVQLCIGQYQVDFNFSPETSISVEGSWELRDAAGKLIDQIKRGTQADALHAQVLLGQTVDGFSVDAPRSFCLRFNSGHLLTIFDDSVQYESFSIQPGDIFV
jgi:hypothetical protein